MAEEIIEYLDAKLYDAVSGVFYGCEDWLRHEPPIPGGDEFRTIIDRCVYTDANAVVSAAYLDAASLLGKPEYRKRALGVLDFLWKNGRGDGAAMCHYFDGAAHVSGLLQDQAQMGSALLRAYEVTGRAARLDRARQLAEFILAELSNPAGGFYDIHAQDSAALRLRLTLIEQTNAAASFFLALAQATSDAKYRAAARHVFSAVFGDFAQFGVHAAPFGRALEECLKLA